MYNYEFKNLKEFEEYENRQRKRYWKEFVICWLVLAGIIAILCYFGFTYL